MATPVVVSTSPTIISATAPDTSRLLSDLVTEVSINLGDLYTGLVTAATGPTSFSDTTRLDPDGHWTGGELSIVGSDPPNYGQARTIINWASQVFTTNAFPGAPAVGASYEIRKYPYHTRAAIRSFLTQAAREVTRFDWHYVDSRAGGNTDLTAYHIGQWEYAVPAALGLEFIHKLLYLDIAGQNTATSTSLPGTPNDRDCYYLTDKQYAVEWSAAQAAWVTSTQVPWVEVAYDAWATNMIGTVMILVQDGYGMPLIPDLAPLRFVGSRRPQIPTVDSDPVEFDGNYLAVFATSRMSLRLARGAQDQADFQMKFQDWYKLEGDAFRGTRRALPSGSRRIVQ